MRRPLLVLLTLALIVTGGLWFVGTKARPEQAPVVLAAASLQESLEAAAQVWESKGHPKPVLSFAASSALARQIEAGAPADLFISADEEWMDTLQSKKLIRADTRATMLGNSLVLIAPANSTVALDPQPGFPLAQALGKGRLALADPAGVPAGRYAKEALEKLGVWSSVLNRIAAGDNVRAALGLVAQGEAPLGIVYGTDAKAERRVRVVATFPDDTHTPIVYPIAIPQASRNRDIDAFRAFLLSPEGQGIFRKFGFTTPAATRSQASVTGVVR